MNNGYTFPGRKYAGEFNFSTREIFYNNPRGPAFQNGLICDFIISSCLKIIENMKEGSLKFWKSLSFR